MRPAGRIITYMPFVLEIVVVFRGNDLLALMLNFQTPGGSGQVMGCGLQVRVELKHSKTQTLKHFSVPFSGLCSRAAQCASRDGDIISKIWAGGELFSRLVFLDTSLTELISGFACLSCKCLSRVKPKHSKTQTLLILSIL